MLVVSGKFRKVARESESKTQKSRKRMGNVVIPGLVFGRGEKI